MYEGVFTFYVNVQSIANFGVSFNLNLANFSVSFNVNLLSQSRWSLFDGTWQQRPRELDYRMSFDREEMTLQMQ